MEYELKPGHIIQRRDYINSRMGEWIDISMASEFNKPLIDLFSLDGNPGITVAIFFPLGNYAEFRVIQHPDYDTYLQLKEKFG